MSRTHHDWTAIRAAYIEGRAENPDGDPTRRVWPTLDELAALHGVHSRTIRGRSAREQWPAQREQFQLDVERRAREQHAAARADAIASIDQRGLNASEAGLAMVGHRLSHLLRTAQQQPATQRAADVHARELSTLGLAAWRFVRVKDAVLGTLSLADVPDDAAIEREQQLGEELLAAKVAMRHAERLAAESVDDDVDELAEGVEQGH